MKNRNKYFAISETDKKWGIYAFDCGTSYLNPGDVYPPAGHPESYRIYWKRGRVLNEYQIIYLVNGNGIYESHDSGIIKLEPGTILLIYPDYWHRYKPEIDKTWHTYWIGFGGGFANELVKNLRMTKKNPVKTIGYQEKVIQIFLDILETSQVEYTGYQQVLAGDIVKLMGLIHAIHLKSEFKQKDIDRIIQEAKIILMQKDFNISIEEVSQELNMGYSSFRKLFKNYTGISPGQYQMQHKMNRAVQLLNEGKLSIKEISADLKFETTQYFSRIFKKKTGKSPDEFRKTLQRK